MSVYRSVVLAAQQQQVLGAIDVIEVVILIPRTVRRLRADVTDLGDGGRLATIPEDQGFGAAYFKNINRR